MPAAREDFPVARVAALARLRLSSAEAVLYQHQLTQILAFVDQVRDASVAGRTPSGAETPAPAAERPDAVGPSLPVEAALANAPDTAAAPRLVRVPKVIG